MVNFNSCQPKRIDKEIWAEELADFVPKRIFDAHVHLWSEKHAGNCEIDDYSLRLEVDLEDLRHWSECFFPGREISFLALGTPVPDMDVDGHNSWLASQMESDGNSFASMLVTPDMSAENVVAMIDEHHFIGLKPYRLFTSDPAEAGIFDYLPENLIEVADHYGLTVTLHLSKKNGIADSDNQSDLKYLTKKYPKVKWILAHLARGFNSFTLRDSTHFLKELPNIHYDTSGINDLYSHLLIFKHEDRKRILFGTDNVAAGGVRGKYITYGKAWEAHRGNPLLDYCDPDPTLVFYEELRQLRQAAELLELTPDEINDVFYENAKRLFF